MRTFVALNLYLFTVFFGQFAALKAQDVPKSSQAPNETKESASDRATPDNESTSKKDGEAMSVQEELQRDELVKSIEEPRLSNKWFRGNYLIYDCDKAFYACVNSRSFIQCTDQRTIRIEERRPALGCAPLKRFDSQKECFKVQYEKMQNQVPKLFCVHPNFR